MNKPYVKLDKNNAAVLLVDHQAGLLSLVRDIDPDRFNNNVLALADAARYFKLPTILTTSFEDGPNGPLMPELTEMFPDAPYIARPGQINAGGLSSLAMAVALVPNGPQFKARRRSNTGRRARSCNAEMRTIRYQPEGWAYVAAPTALRSLFRGPP